MKSVCILTDHVSTENSDIAELLGVKSMRVKQLLKERQDEGAIIAEGGNKNHMYKLK